MPASSPRRRVATLRFLAAVFASEAGTAPVEVRPGNAFTWEDVVAMADELRIATALWRVVRLRDDVPAHVASELRERTVRTPSATCVCVTSFVAPWRRSTSQGSSHCLFKGALQLVDGTLEAIGDRSMEDLDLAVRRDELPRAETALRATGYRPYKSKPFFHPHEIPFLLDRSAGPIEVHVELGSPPIPSVLPVAEAWAKSSRLPVAGATAPVAGATAPVAGATAPVAGASALALSPTHQVLHGVLHSAVQDLNHATGGLPLRQLLIVSRLVRVHGQAVDWEELRRRMEEHGLAPELREYLWLAQRFAGMPSAAGEAGDLARASRLHDARVLASFALGWPADVQRNLRYAFGRAYLDSLYGHGNRPARLALARARHAIRIVRRDGRRALELTLARKV